MLNLLVACTLLLISQESVSKNYRRNEPPKEPKPVPPKVYEIAMAEESNEVTFSTISSPDLVTIEGKGGKVYGKIEISNKNMVVGDLKVLTGNFETGIALRDEHLKTYLGSKEHPFARLLIEEMPYKENGSFKGVLTIKNDTKPVTGEYSLKNGILSAKLSINVKDFPSIGVPTYLGVTAADKVDLNVVFPFKK